MRSRQQVETDIELFRNLFSGLSEELDLGKDAWDIGMIRFCLENMGFLTGRSAPAMLDFLQRLNWKGITDDEAMLDRCLALIPDEPTYRMLDEIMSVANHD